MADQPADSVLKREGGQLRFREALVRAVAQPLYDGVRPRAVPSGDARGAAERQHKTADGRGSNQ
ncbi:MAG TPA: hypothetical protein VK009_02315 [Chloroflexota bacterium]|nr:hypothetical protein [Chloroflexota bacterium]